MRKRSQKELNCLVDSKTKKTDGQCFYYIQQFVNGEEITSDYCRNGLVAIEACISRTLIKIN